jgi:hypothetical protein
MNLNQFENEFKLYTETMEYYCTIGCYSFLAFQRHIICNFGSRIWKIWIVQVCLIFWKLNLGIDWNWLDQLAGLTANVMMMSEKSTEKVAQMEKLSIQKL